MEQLEAMSFVSKGLFFMFQLGLTAAVGACGWFLRGLTKDLQDIEKNLHDTQVELPKAYVRKADLDGTMRDIKDHLVRIENKLDHKVDK